MAMLKFDVHNRWTGAVQFTAEIECAADAPRAIKMGMAVRWACANGFNLSGSDLSGSDLSGSNLSGSNLSVSNLSGSDLSGSDLSYSNLSYSNLSGSNLSGSNLSVSNLSGSYLSGSNLSGSNLSYSDLRGSNLSGSNLVLAGMDSRGYEFYLTGGKVPRFIIIRAGCRRWMSFAEARVYYGPEYKGDGIVPEIMAKLDMLEIVARFRGYLPVED